MHPVMQRLIYMKWLKFGRRGAWLDLATNLLFSILWTVLGVTLPHKAKELYEPLTERWWRLVLAILVMFLTFVEIFKQVASVYRVKKSLTKWKGKEELKVLNSVNEVLLCQMTFCLLNDTQPIFIEQKPIFIEPKAK
jgi:uncharacterized membrane protein